MDILVALRKSYFGVIMRSLWPSCSSPNPNMTIGVTLIIVMMTTEAKMSNVIVDRERQLMSPLDFILTAQFFFTCVSIPLDLKLLQSYQHHQKSKFQTNFLVYKILYYTQNLNLINYKGYHNPMGCNNSNAMPEQIGDIRKTISKIVPDQDTSTGKKIAKSFKSFEEFSGELMLMLKEDGFYDYLFKAEYFQDMLQFITSSYVNHQHAMRIVEIVLEYMALTLNFINGRQNLRTNFHVNSLASELFERWTEIRTEVFYMSKNALKILNYLAYNLGEQKCWFSHSYLNLKFDFSVEESISVAKVTQSLCKYNQRSFFYLSNYLLKSCLAQYQRTNTVMIVEEKLTKTIQQILVDVTKPLPLNGQEHLFEHHQNFKSNLLDNANFTLDLSKTKPNLRVQTLESFIFEKAKASIQSNNTISRIFQSICDKNGCSHFHSEVRLKSRSQKKEILKIKQQFIGYQSQKKSIEQLSKNNVYASFEDLINIQYEGHQKQITSFCQSLDGVVKFKITDMVRGECMFTNLSKLNQCCADILKDMTKKGYKLIELSNRLRGGHGAPHILLHILIDGSICQFKLIFQYNLGGYYFSHLMSDMVKSKYFSPLTRLKLFNEQITNNFMQEINQIIEANINSKMDYGERLTFLEVKPFFKELIDILPFQIDLSKKSYASIDFNLIFDQLQEYKAIAQQSINDQIKIDRTDKIRRIAEYMFYQKKYDLSEILFSLYQKQIQENHAYLIDKIKNKSKDFIKAQVELIEFYADSIHFLAQIYREKKEYSRSIQTYYKYMPLISLVHQNKKEGVKVLKKIAEILKLQKKYDEAIKIYHQCIQMEEIDDIQCAQIYYLLALVCIKQARFDEALKYEFKSLLIIEKKVGINNLEYENGLKYVSEVFKLNSNYGEAIDRLQKRKQLMERLQCKYSLQYAELLKELGMIQQKMDNFNKALLCYQQSLEIITKIQGDYYDEYQKLYYKIGGMELRLGNYQQAIKNFKESLYLANKLYGSNNLQCANILSNLAFALQHLAQYQEALRCFEKCSQIKKEKLGSKNIQYVRTIINIGILYDEQERSKQAYERYKESLNILNDQNHVQSTDYAILLNNIGLIEHKRGNYKLALQNFERALQIHQKLDGFQSKQYANTLSNIGMVKDDMCKYSEALLQYKKCLTIYEKLNGKSQIAATYNNIGTTLLHLSNYSQALHYYQKSLQLEQSLNEAQTRQYSMCLHCIGIVKFQQNELEQAEKLYEQSKSILKKVRASNSLEYSQILVSLGKLCLRKGQLMESLVHFDEALNILGSMHERFETLLITIYLNKGIANFRLKNNEQSAHYLQKSLHICQNHELKYREYAEINYNLGVIQIKKEKYFLAKKYFLLAMRLQQQFHDKYWKLTASKLALCSFINEDEINYKIYSSYLSEDCLPIKNQKHHDNKKVHHK